MQNIAMNITYVLLADVRISFILTFCATMLEMYNVTGQTIFPSVCQFINKIPL